MLSIEIEEKDSNKMDEKKWCGTQMKLQLSLKEVSFFFTCSTHEKKTRDLA